MHASSNRLLPAILLLFVASAVAAQEEKPVPKDSARVQIAGCARKRNFTVERAPESEPRQTDIEPGRHFRMNAKKELLADIHAHERTMIEITGLVRKSDLGKQPGVSIDGGRVRISPGNPQEPLGNPALSAQYYRSTIDVESWRPLPAECK
jgi:hypothetical protein